MFQVPIKAYCGALFGDMHVVGYDAPHMTKGAIRHVSAK